MRLCLFARPYLAPGGDFDAFLEIARIADQAGVHSIAFGEHLVMGEGTHRYPYGPWIHPADSAWMDPLTSLAAVAAVTQRLRLSTGVLIAPLRAGLVLAKAVATLDVVSKGRVELGVGTGWQPEEYAGVGLSWQQRQQRFDEVIEICRTAWGDQPFDLTVDGTALTGLTSYPTPVQERVPVYYGVKVTETNARRIARLGDGWTPVGVSPDDVRQGVDRIHAAYAEAGREPSTAVIRVAVAPLAPGADVRAAFLAARPFVDAGANLLVAGFNDRLDSIEQARDLVEQAVAAAAEVG